MPINRLLGLQHAYRFPYNQTYYLYYPKFRELRKKPSQISGGRTNQLQLLLGGYRPKTLFSYFYVKSQWNRGRNVSSSPDFFH